MRVPMLLLLAGLLAGCNTAVALRNPTTGKVATCPAQGSDLNPWSQQTACVGAYEAQGWVRASVD